MTKTLAITAIVLVAVVMGLSTIAPALQQAFAHDVKTSQGRAVGVQCPADFQRVTIEPVGTHPDHNANGFVCVEFICPGLGPTPGDAFPRCRDFIKIVIDDIPPIRVRAR